MKKKFLFVLLSLVLLLAACLPSQEQIDEIIKSAEQTAIAQITVVPAATQDVNVIVQATFQSLTLTAQAPAGTTGGISGNLSYPSEGIPPLLVVAFNVNSDSYYWVVTQQNQQTYQIDNLPAGTYHVYAYILPDGSLVGAYDQFYLCGLNQGCTDFTMVDVVVQAGIVTPNVNPGDWYRDNALNKPMPNIQGVTDESKKTGAIAGQLSYPSNFIPALKIIAFDVNSQSYYYASTSENQSIYNILDVPPGTYHVVAYLQDGSLSAGYSQAVLCGLLAECIDHSLIPVNVPAGGVVNQVNPQDWYAPPGSFPAYPLP
ncbi:MAG: hypothetical protein HC797_07160 [Anaerolineales bacterium]|nr:hypothetical protein [Anaerolineales bacterium]